MKQHITTEKTYYIAHNDNNIFHYDSVDAENCICTGQPYLEVFTVEQEWVDRLSELGIDDPYSEEP